MIKKDILIIFLLLAEIACAQNKIPKNGFSISCFPNTKTISESGHYKNGKKDGAWTAYWSTGKPKEIYNYKEGNKEGTYTLFNDEGMVIKEGVLNSAGCFVGTEYSYEKGDVRKEIIYLQPLCESPSLIPSLKKTKELIFDLNNGTVREEKFYFNDQKDSTWKYYDENGMLVSIETFKNGKRHGIYEKYYPGNKLAERANFENGKHNGLRVILSENGDTTESGNYVSGNRDGFFTMKENIVIKEISEDKKKYSVCGNYKEGKANGKFILQHENGRTAAEESYADGKLIGERKLYNETGTLIFSCSYANNIKTGPEKKYFDSGKLQKETSYDEAGIVLTQTTYFENGKKSEEVVYDKGKMKSYIRYHENGKVRSKALYDEKGIQIKKEMFDEKGKKIDTKYKEFTELKTNPTEDTTVYTFVDEMPEFPGGPGELYKFISSHIEWPETHKEDGIPSSKIYLNFIVGSDGRVEEIKPIVKNCVPCEIAIEKVAKSLPEFKPGKLKGIPVRVQVSIPINIHWK